MLGQRRETDALTGRTIHATALLSDPELQNTNNP